jgi:RNA polymerase sigma factor (sigma-70 family)
MTGSQTDIEDDALLRQIGRSDGTSEHAFSVLYKRYRLSLQRFFVSRGFTKYEAEDVYQETMMRVARSARNFDGSGQAKSWIWQIARNCCIDQQRIDRAIRDRESISDDLEAALAAPQVMMPEPLLREEPEPSKTPVDLDALVKNYDKFKRGLSQDSVELHEAYNQDAVRSCVLDGVTRFKALAPERHRALMMAVHGFAIDEIAEALGRTASATKVFLFECRKKIAPLLTPCWELSRG